MKWFLDLSIKTKLLSGFLFVAVIAACIGFIGISSLQTADESDTFLYERNTVPVSLCSTISTAFQRSRVNLLKIIIAKDEAARDDQIKRLMDRRQEIDKAFDEISRTVVAEDVRALLSAAIDSRKTFEPITDQIIALSKSNRVNEATAMYEGPGEKARNAHQDALIKLNNLLVERAKRRSEQNTVEAKTAVRTMSAIMIAGVLLAVLLGIAVTNMLSKPIRSVVTSIDNADLHSQFNSARKDEIGDLQRSFDKFVQTIKDTLLQVSEASSAVASSSSEISSSTEQMAAGAQEQTSQTSEVASAVEEMAKTIVENSRNAAATAETANKAKKAAEFGGTVVEETVSGMKQIADVVMESAATVRELGKSSEQIGEIIGVIEDIADQTNLLALNAAIEAARAGDQGRGFAVVADEVRKLAERTTKATKEIAAMIKKIQADTKGAVASMEIGTKQVDKGIALADKAGVSLSEIVGISQKVTDMVAQIAAASEQQSSASEQISRNVDAISNVTNESAAGVQQVARAAEDLNRLTENLQNLLGKFKLSDNDRKDISQHKQTKGMYATKKSLPSFPIVHNEMAETLN